MPPGHADTEGLDANHRVGAAHFGAMYPAVHRGVGSNTDPEVGRTALMYMLPIGATGGARELAVGG